MTLPLLFASLTLLVVLWNFQVVVAAPVLSIDVAHAISFGRGSAKHQAGASAVSGQSSFGSKQWLLRGIITQFTPGDTDTYAGRTVFVPTEVHLSHTDWQRLVSLPVKGVVVATSPFDRHNEIMLQQHFSQAALPIPVYFLPHDGVGAESLRGVFKGLGSSELVGVSVGASTQEVIPTMNTSFTGINLYASLKVESKEAYGNVPQLLVTASFDTFGVAPASLTTGGASGAVAAMDLWWRFHTEAALETEKHAGAGSNSTMTNPYSVSVLLGNTARFNYLGTKRWLSTQRDEDLDRYALVLCLDELLTSDSGSDSFGVAGDSGTSDGNQRVVNRYPLYMHVHDSFASDPYFLQVKAMAEVTAAKHGIDLTVIVSKTNYHHYDIQFEHEVLAHHQIHAVTISSIRRYRDDQIFRGERIPLSTPPNTSRIDTAVARQLRHRVDFVHAFAKALLQLPEGGNTAGGPLWVGNDAYMLGMLRHAAMSHRSPVTNGGTDQLIYAKGLGDHMQKRLTTLLSPSARRMLSSKVSLSTYRFSPPGIVFFGPYESVMHVFVVKRSVVELSILLVALVVVGIFSVLELGLTRTISVLMNREEVTNAVDNKSN